MDDPGKLLEGGMTETAKTLALRSSIKEGQRLLAEAIRQRNLAQSEARRQLDCRVTERSALRSISEHWAFFFLPAMLKDQVIRLMGAEP